MMNILKNNVVGKCSDEKYIENVVGTCRVSLNWFIIYKFIRAVLTELVEIVPPTVV